MDLLDPDLLTKIIAAINLDELPLFELLIKQFVNITNSPSMTEMKQLEVNYYSFAPDIINTAKDSSLVQNYLDSFKTQLDKKLSEPIRNSEVDKPVKVNFPKNFDFFRGDYIRRYPEAKTGGSYRLNR